MINNAQAPIKSVQNRLLQHFFNKKNIVDSYIHWLVKYHGIAYIVHYYTM